MPSTVSWRRLGECVHCGMRQMHDLNEGGGEAQRMREAHECPLHWPLFSQPDCRDCNCQGSRQTSLRTTGAVWTWISFKNTNANRDTSLDDGPSMLDTTVISK
jgi:hypothetical protein